MVLGGLVLALVFAQLTDAIVGARLAQALGQGPLPKRDHVVVCGVGRTGGRILEDLVAAGVPCIAVEREEGAVDAGRLRRLGVLLVVGDAASGETLDDLRLGSADAHGDDERRPGQPSVRAAGPGAGPGPARRPAPV